MAYDTINDAVTIPGKGEGAIRRSRGTRDPTWRPRRGAALPWCAWKRETRWQRVLLGAILVERAARPFGELRIEN